MSKLFEVTEINGMQLSNRFVRSATWEGMAEDDGSVTPALVDCMSQLAEGQVGLIIFQPCLHQAGRTGRT